MALVHQLFNHQPPAQPLPTETRAVQPGDPSPPYQPPGGFISTQSIVTFPGATAAISIIWGFLNYVVKPGAEGKMWIGVSICAVIGLIIYLINVTDPNAPTTTRDKLIGFMIAIINTMVLFMASFGVATATGAGSS